MVMRLKPSLNDIICMQMGNGSSIPEGKSVEGLEAEGAMEGADGQEAAGMVLPFQPSAVTFRGMNYFVPCPPV